MGTTTRSIWALVVVVLAASLGPLAPSALAQPSLPPTPPRDKWFAYNDKGHFTAGGTQVRVDRSCLSLPQSARLECSLKKFRDKGFVVIAFVDTGINPYHQDFRASEFSHHPSRYIEGYPSDAPALDVSLERADAAGYAAARKADDAMWEGLEARKLYWVPGTRIIGAISIGEGRTVCGGIRIPVIDEPCTDPYPERKVLDDNGHGTGVASVAAGRFFGSNPNALIVAVEGLGEASLEWATSQRWIDIVSNSWGTLANLPLGQPRGTKEATERGQTVAFSAGNGATNTNSSRFWPPLPGEDPCKCKTPDSNPSITGPYGGPSWLLTVGAISPVNGQAHWWHSIPVDVSSFGSKWRAAGPFGVTPKLDYEDNVQTRDFGGTSCATPVTAGVLSSIIERAREVLNDDVAGQKAKQVVAQGVSGAKRPKKGPLEDGKLTRLEAEALVQKTAFPTPVDPQKLTWDYAVRPTTPVYYVYQGYGVVHRESKELALKVLLGQEPLPDRTEVDVWLQVVDLLRDAIWDR